jgi:ATP-dependent HslUV protease ATP-binding subunit HslU
MIRDLVDISVNMVRGEKEDEFGEVAADRVEERLLDLLLPPLAEADSATTGTAEGAAGSEASRTFVVGSTGIPQLEPIEGDESLEGRRRRTREKLRGLLRDEKLEDREVEVEVSEASVPTMDVGAMGMDGLDFNIGEMLQDMLPKRTRRRMVTVAEARRILLSEETDKLIDMEEVVDEAVARAEHMGIIFLDELDKVAGSRRDQGPDVSREGVQRDLLPIVEGSTVQTRYGMVRTEHVLFIAAGAFHVSRPSDLIPELQGRFPIRVELHSLGKEEFVRILLEPKNALLTQYMALVATEGAELEFQEDAIHEIARIAADVNQSLENIGARRLHTVLTTLLEDVMFNLPDTEGPPRFVIDATTVRERLARIVEDDDLRRYIL